MALLQRDRPVISRQVDIRSPGLLKNTFVADQKRQQQNADQCTDDQTSPVGFQFCFYLCFPSGGSCTRLPGSCSSFCCCFWLPIFRFLDALRQLCTHICSCLSMLYQFYAKIKH